MAETIEFPRYSNSIENYEKALTTDCVGAFLLPTALPNCIILPITSIMVL